MQHPVNSLLQGCHEEVLAWTTATAAKTSLLQWISVFQTWSSLFQFAENIQYRQISLELISWGPHSSLERERPFRGRLFVYSIKREIRHFYVVVVRQWQRNVQKSMMHVQTCCFFLINLLLFWHSRCQLSHRC